VKTRVVVIGAGAIGRGYLPWVLDLDKHDLIFVDADDEIIGHLKSVGHYTTYQIDNDQYEKIEVPALKAFRPDSFQILNETDVVACFLAVGPRNVIKAAESLVGSIVPIIVCENDPESAKEVSRIVGHEHVYFAVPDVITSNTAPKSLLTSDPLSVVTEKGDFFLEAGPVGLHGSFNYMSKEDLIRSQWIPKLYLHNTPHSIAAYLGALVGADYMHEAMEHEAISKIVEGSMKEMLQALKMEWDTPHEFLDWYAEKELARFRCNLLYDPISRVAREPLRKLEMHGRLLGAAQMCISLGVMPQNILKGIMGALLFKSQTDSDHYVSLMRDALSTSSYNRYVLGLRPHEPLDLMLRRLNFNMEEVAKQLLDLESE